MYVMPELGLIVALEPSKVSGFQTKVLPAVLNIHTMTIAVHITVWFLPMKTMTFSVIHFSWGWLHL